MGVPSGGETTAHRAWVPPSCAPRHRDHDEEPAPPKSLGAFLTRRLGCVRGEFSLTALAYNIRRAISLVGVPGLIAAAQA